MKVDSQELADKFRPGFTCSLEVPSEYLDSFVLFWKEETSNPENDYSISDEDYSMTIKNDGKVGAIQVQSSFTQPASNCDICHLIDSIEELIDEYKDRSLIKIRFYLVSGKEIYDRPRMVLKDLPVLFKDVFPIFKNGRIVSWE